MSLNYYYLAYLEYINSMDENNILISYTDLNDLVEEINNL